jgi:P-type Ca2+ transporter type 2C
MNNSWHTKSPAETIKALQTNEKGLSKQEVKKRQKKYGLNKLPEAKSESIFWIFLHQFQSPLIYILLIASVIVFIMKEPIDGFVILGVLLFNAILGSIQEGKAQNTLMALREFVETNATVIRDGEEIIVNDTEIVPGDILLLQEGEKIPADARIFLTHNLRIDESALTGESEAVQKTTDKLEKKKLATMEQKNMVFKGTNIVSGSGKAIVLNTGINTVIGQIAAGISKIDTEIPLKKNIKSLSKFIIIVVGIVGAFLFIAGTFLGKSAVQMFMTVVALSVSIIPEGLPVVITLILTTGVWRMGKRNALVKKLHAVEALGQAKIIAVDKTGTVTKNEIVVQKIYIDNNLYTVETNGYEPKGEVVLNNKKKTTSNDKNLALMGKLSTLCSSAHVMFNPEKQVWKVSGDPTEAAMGVLGQKLGFNRGVLEKTNPLLDEIPFESQLKYHAVLHGDKEENFMTVTGAPELILQVCSKIWNNEKNKALTKKMKTELEEVFHGMSKEGLRVVAIAKKTSLGKNLSGKKVEDLTFVGFLGMKDAIRNEVAQAIKKAQKAGIRVVMITGDHKITAESIGKEAGIYKKTHTIITGAEIDKMTPEEMAKKLGKTSVFARVTPEHKLKIIEAFKARGEIIAMTGDGVNDAPSLVAANLGVAMGKIGTEVAKEAADIVLLDDNFESITAAIEEGRNIYRTIKKVITYLFSTGAGEVMIIMTAVLLTYPLPILPTQIIWLNFVTDGFLVATLAMEPKDKDLLDGKFEDQKKFIVDKLMGRRILFMSLTMATLTLLLFRELYEVDMAKALTFSLTTMAVFQWFNVYNCRSETKSIFQTSPFSNKYLLGATVLVIVLQLFAVYHPTMQNIFHTTALTFREWMIIIPVGASIIVVEEARKLVARRHIAKKQLNSIKTGK